MPGQGDAATKPLTRASLPGVSLTIVPVDEGATPRPYQAVILKEGTFVPGLGNPNAIRYFFPRETLAAMAASGNGKAVNLEHVRTVENEVGVMQDVHMDGDGIRLRADVILQPQRPRFPDALGFIEGRLKAGQVPNVSVEVIDILTRPAPREQAHLYDEVIVQATLDGLAILPVGACSDKDGCGIGLTAHAFPVLVPFGGRDTTKENPENMADPPKGASGGAAPCGCGGAPDIATLQAKVKELEAELAAKTTEATSLAAKVQGYEAAEVQALTEAVQAHAPPGTDIKSIVGPEPTKASLTAALKAFQAAKPAGDGLGMGGRKTAPPARKEGESVVPNKDALLALRAKYGLPEKSALPPALAKNSAKVLTAVEGRASAQ